MQTTIMHCKVLMHHKNQCGNNFSLLPDNGFSLEHVIVNLINVTSSNNNNFIFLFGDHTLCLA